MPKNIAFDFDKSEIVVNALFCTLLAFYASRLQPLFGYSCNFYYFFVVYFAFYTLYILQFIEADRMAVCEFKLSFGILEECESFSVIFRVKL